MKKLSLILAVLTSLSAYSQTYICQMGHSGDMDIVIKGQAISTVFYTMAGDKTTYTNTQVSAETIEKLESGNETPVIVSTSNLQSQFDGAYLNAGIVLIKKRNNTLEVKFASKGIVHQAVCR